MAQKWQRNLDSKAKHLLTFLSNMVDIPMKSHHDGHVDIEGIRRMVIASLMAALMAVGAYIHLPIGPVPMVLTNLFVFLSGLLLGSRWGPVSVGLYLMAGATGLPVFAGGRGGVAHFLGPTGGYLLGYVFAAWVVGIASERSRGLLAVEIVGVGMGIVAIYAVGIPWLKWVTQLPWAKALMVGMAPFLIGDAVKASVAIVLARAVRPMLVQHRTGSQ